MMGLPHMLSSLWQGMTGTSSDDSTITIHPDTHDPTKAWEKLSVKQTVKKVKPLSVNTPIREDKIRFVCVSDTHNRLPLRTPVPDGDVLLHAGDFSMVGKPAEIVQFNDWLGSLPHTYKVVIAGNHDMSFDESMLAHPDSLHQFGLHVSDVDKFKSERGVSRMSEVLTNCIYLQDSHTTIYGVRIYGSPWQPWFHDWGFNLERGQPCLGKWNLIPDDVDVLLTHGPPIGHGDECSTKERAGCVELLQTIQKRVRCQYHVFGHIHEGYGMTTDGHTKYINASTCTHNYRPCNPPIIFDMDLPPGMKKSDFTNPPIVQRSQEGEEGQEEEEMETEGEEENQEKEEEKVPLVLEQEYHLEPTPAPHSSTSIATGSQFKH